MDIDEEPQPEAPQSPEFQPAPTTSGRQRRFPRHYQDFLPNSNIHIPHMPPKPIIRRDSTPAPPNNTEMSPSPSPDIPEPSVITTKPDEFGLYRVYISYPSSNPDDVQDLTDHCDALGLSTVPKSHALKWWAGFGCAVPDLAQRLVTMFLCRS